MPRLKQINPLKILKLVRREIVGTETVEREYRGIEFSLVTNVVNREHARGIGEGGKDAVPRLEEDGGNGGHPVMDMRDVGNPTRVLANLQSGLAQDTENGRRPHRHCRFRRGQNSARNR